MKKFLFLPIIFFAINSIAQHKPDQYHSSYKTIDSLISTGFPKSADSILEQVYRNALAAGDQNNQLRVLIYRMNTRTNDDNVPGANYYYADSLASISHFPQSNIWHSLAGALLWSYYNNNRWQILQRTALTENTSMDIDQWDAPKFFSVISAHFKSSLVEPERLVGINISDIEPIIDTGVNTRALRPSLYDLLAFRASGWFEDEEKDLVRPADHFTLHDPLEFSPAHEFSQAHFLKSSDPDALQYQALKIYQQILARMEASGNTEGLIDADLHRLEFVHNYSVLSGKDSLFRQALENIVSSYPGSKGVAEARYQILLLEYGTGIVNSSDVARNKKDLKTIHRQLEELIREMPGTEGAAHASLLLWQMDMHRLDLTTEQVVLPNENSRILVKYTNTPSVYFRLIKLTYSELRRLPGLSDSTKAAFLGKASVVKQWQEVMPAADDYHEHSAELKIDGLEPGIYVLVAGEKDVLDVKNNTLAYASFQVNSTSIVALRGTKSGTAAYILDRKTGMPVSSALVQFYSDRWNSKKQLYEETLQHSATSDANGLITIPNSSYSYSSVHISANGSTLYLNQGFYAYNYNNRIEDEQHTFFFTDRSIYRPGQSIYFKGIMLKSSGANRKNEILPNLSTSVSFYDANGQLVSTLPLKSNEFGSFTGTFTAPSSLTGEMTIRNESGTASVSVEEYKRPKFSVDFDTLKNTYHLNELVTVSGKAMAYAGNALDGAAVKYSITRNTSWPYWWAYWYWGSPQSQAVQISQGVATTDSAGSFTLSFTTEPDLAINPAAMPVFSYLIQADITDINGETHSSTQTVNAGYTSIKVRASVPASAAPADLDTIYIATTNLNDVFVSASVHVKIAPLIQPSFLPRKRLWQRPDQHFMDSVTFRGYFPIDEYGNETDFRSWAEGEVILEKDWTSTKDGQFSAVAARYPANGYYLIEVTTQDASGKKITDKEYVAVWDHALPGDVMNALSVHNVKPVYEPGDSVTAIIKTPYQQGHITEIAEYADGNEMKTPRTVIPALPLTWTKKIMEDDRGGIALQWMMVKENRVYTAAANVAVPWSNKQLNISWETHRDKMQPGDQETWTMVVKGVKKEKVAAEMVAALYDASLDAIKPQSWGLYGLFPTTYAHTSFETSYGFGISGSVGIANRIYDLPLTYNKAYDDLISGGYRIYDYEYTSRHAMLRNVFSTTAITGAADESAPPTMLAGASVQSQTKSAGARASGNTEVMDKDRSGNYREDGLTYAWSGDGRVSAGERLEESAPVTLRKNLAETAFFYPQLKTDAEGNVRIQFTIPESLTEWRLLTFAHTKDLKSGTFTGTVKTQKDLMVVPGLPRFFRQGDDLVISAKISNLSANDLNGNATIEIVDAQTLKPLNIPFRISNNTAPFKSGKSGSTVVSWNIHVPESIYEPVLVRIAARAGSFTDGEENPLPVVSNRMLVTDTYPIWMNGAGTKTVSVAALTGMTTGSTVSPYALTVEYTPNPAWYAVQALPYLMEYPYECAEQTFNRYYANALAGHIVSLSPKVEAIFSQWEDSSPSGRSGGAEDTTALLSNLEKNEELKTALLEETPWVMEAKSETEQKHRIALLFQSHKLSRMMASAMRKLEQMQLSDGSFPWFKGGTGDRYITQYIVTGLMRLQHLGVDISGAGLMDKAAAYCNRRMKSDYDDLVRSKAKMDLQQIGQIEVEYLYMKSFEGTPTGNADFMKAFNYYKGQAAKYWSSFDPQLKAMIALTLNRLGDAKTSAAILESLRQTSIHKEEMGTYWIEPGYGYWWYQSPIETQSVIIEAFNEAGKDTVVVNEAKRWLIKQKQTENWHSTKATADACYALLITGSDWLQSTPVVTIQAGNQIVSSANSHAQAGTGYIKHRFSAPNIIQDMGNVSITVTPETNQPVNQSTNQPSWGAVYFQYFENLDKIHSFSTPLSLEKHLFVKRNTANGVRLEEITDNAPLLVGDKVTSRIILKVDRDMEYVHLKDMRAACFEPVDVLSAYKYQDGLGYYQSTRDASSNFFFSLLLKGTYVFEYDVKVTNKGNYSNGIATIQCMYAPEFSAHSEGIRVDVK